MDEAFVKEVQSRLAEIDREQGREELKKAGAEILKLCDDPIACRLLETVMSKNEIKTAKRRVSANASIQERRRRVAHARREQAEFERIVESLSPTQQAFLFGRTADSVLVNGRLRKVDMKLVFGTFDELEKRQPSDILLHGLVGLVSLAATMGRSVAKRLMESVRHLSEGHVTEQAGTSAKMKGAFTSRTGRNVEDCSLERVENEERHINRLVYESEKVQLRCTIAEPPTPAEVLSAYLQRRTRDGRLRLGMVMRDLEAHVNNSIHWITADGRLQIAWREPGILGWLRGNLPMLVPKYKSLMAYKSLAEKVVVVVLDAGGELSAESLTSKEVVPKGAPVGVPRESATWLQSFVDKPLYVQPRNYTKRKLQELGLEDGTSVKLPRISSRYVRERFCWEHEDRGEDTFGRRFHHNRNYWLPASGGWIGTVPRTNVTIGWHLTLASLMRVRAGLERLLAEDDTSRSEADRIAGRYRVSSLWRIVKATIARREVWWEGDLATA